ncbi:MAG: integration host factor subunit beta [Desulfuromonadales bacterium]|nr:integration host factor subunit beta [Desulfuromonadales bacterium]
MTRSELVEKIAIEKNITYAVAEKLILEIFGSMADTLIAGDRIELRGFGSFENRYYGGHTGRNPKTGVDVTVVAKKRPFFKAGKDLKERIMMRS